MPYKQPQNYFLIFHTIQINCWTPKQTVFPEEVSGVQITKSFGRLLLSQ